MHSNFSFASHSCRQPFLNFRHCCVQLCTKITFDPSFLPCIYCRLSQAQPWVFRYRRDWQSCCGASLWWFYDKGRQTWWILQYSTSPVCKTPEVRMRPVQVTRPGLEWWLTRSRCRQGLIEKLTKTMSPALKVSWFLNPNQNSRRTNGIASLNQI